MNPDFTIVTEFERRIAEFLGAPYAVAVDSCTHGIELCLRRNTVNEINCPVNTYISIPMLANKLRLHLNWERYDWKEFYYLTPSIIDAAVLWRKNSYVSSTFMCLSFQYQKHLSLGRGGMILCDNKEAAEQLKKMSYDGRLPNIPWREQDIDTMGYHYYMTPDTAALGLSKLEEAINTEPRKWTVNDWPDISRFKIFNTCR